jgi:tetratricopeptide (TPR) repeat protein
MKLSLVVCTVLLLTSHAVAADLSGNAEFQQGLAQFNAADYARAFAAFDNLKPDLNTSSEFNYYYSLSLLKTERTDQAIEAMERAIELAPDNADYRYALGLIYAARMSELSLFGAAMIMGSAKETLVKAVELAPDHVGATAALIEFLLDVPGLMGGDQEGAEDLIKKLWTMDPAAAAALEAKLEVRNGNDKRAEELYLQAVATPGGLARTRLKLAKFFLDRQRYPEAIKYATEYLDMPKQWSDFYRDTTYAHLWLAISYHALGDEVNSQHHSKAIDTSGMPERVREEIEEHYADAGIE